MLLCSHEQMHCVWFFSSLSHAHISERYFYDAVVLCYAAASQRMRHRAAVSMATSL